MTTNNLITWAERHQQDITAIASGYRALVERGLVAPMAISININSPGQLAWGWYKYKALSSHPHPRNAKRGYTHPNDYSVWKLTANNCDAGTIVTHDDVAGANEWEVNKYVISPILDAIGFGAGSTEFGTEWETIFCWGDDKSLHAIDLTRGGVNPWAEYPDADLKPETEINRRNQNLENKKMNINQLRHELKKIIKQKKQDGSYNIKNCAVEVGVHFNTLNTFLSEPSIVNSETIRKVTEFVEFEKEYPKES